MKPTNPTLNALLASRQFYTCDLYTITMVGGSSLYYCQGQSDIVFSGHTFSAGGTTGPFWDRSDNKAKVSWKTGTGTDQLVIDCIPGAATVLGQPFLSAIRWGFFDGAQFTLQRAFMPTFGNTAAGAPIMFLGRVAEVDAGRSLTTWTINDYRELLSQQWPRNIFQAGCVNTFGDASCTINQNSFSVPGTVLAGPTISTVSFTSAQASGFFSQGKIKFTSGVNSGLTFSVSASAQVGSNNAITTVVPMTALASAGDTFTLFQGCDRTLGPGGCPKFSNTANFRGFPYTPAPETAL